jgi:hypothetical protein
MGHVNSVKKIGTALDLWLKPQQTIALLNWSRLKPQAKNEINLRLLLRRQQGSKTL